jgi:hypothetical protein
VIYPCAFEFSRETRYGRREYDRATFKHLVHNLDKVIIRLSFVAVWIYIILKQITQSELTCIVKDRMYSSMGVPKAPRAP